MADKKISALTSATTPLAGTEVLPIVQSGSTVKVAVNDMLGTISGTSPAVNSEGNIFLRATDALAAGVGTQIGLGGKYNASSYFPFGGISARKENSTNNNVAGYTDILTTTSGGTLTARMRFNSTGDGTLLNGNFVVGTAGKGIADSAGSLKLAITTTSVAASSVLSGGLTHRLGAYSAGETTPSVTGVSHLDIANASPTTITNFTGAVRGQMLLLLFRDGNTTITRANAYLAGAVDFTSANRATLLLMFDGSFWYEVCRSTTNG